MNKLFVCLGLFCLAPFFMMAQSPKAFNYQAVARGQNGEVLSGQMIGMRISILQETINGSSVFSERHEVMTNAFGLLNLKVGAGQNLSGSMNDIEWGKDDFFLKVEMDITGGSSYVDMGTTQLLSVPYAMHASRADTAEIAVLADQANLAETAGYAEQAGQASFAENAVNAQQATFAQNATNAQSASFAQEAQFAQTAGNSYWQSDKEDIYYDSEGSVGIGIKPTAKLQVHQGDVYIDNVGRGVIMRDNLGKCWRMTIDAAGRVQTTPLEVCPGEE
jgi:hypothetical protein